MISEEKIFAAQKAAGCEFNYWGECETHEGRIGLKGGDYICLYVQRILDAALGDL